MGWLRAMFSGHNPEATREILRLAFRQNLRRVDNKTPIMRRLDASTHALRNRYKSRGYNKPLEAVALEVLPFAFLSDDECEAGLAEYVTAMEHKGGADADWLQTTIRRGLDAFVANSSDDYAPVKIKLLNVLTHEPDLPAWCIFLNEEDIGKIVDGSKTAMEQLGFDTTGMFED